VGSQVITAASGTRDEASYERMKAQVTEALRQTFRPEFLNRIDEIIVFHSLTDEDLAVIVDLLVADLARRLEEHDLVLELTPGARTVIAREGHDPQFGARPLKRAVQRLVENPLAKALLEGRFPPGSTIMADADPVSGTLVFTGSGGEAVVADAAERRDARAAGREPVGAGTGGRSIFDLPDGPDTERGSDRLN
jgi:ATP-dependent Clp protease ATP-binding subunit ClpA